MRSLQMQTLEMRQKQDLERIHRSNTPIVRK